MGRTKSQIARDSQGTGFRRRIVWPGLLGLLFWGIALGPAWALGTEFTYQGRLLDNGTPVNGDYGFWFKLYDAATGGSTVAPDITTTVTVTDGLFSAGLDFGTGAFNGERRWLEIGVRKSGDSTYDFSGTRQEVTPAPYAMHASEAETTDLATSATQALYAVTSGDSDKLGGQDGAYYLNRANHTGTQSPATISPQGAGSNLDADTVDGLHASELLDKVTYDPNGDGVVDYATTATHASTADLATTATYAVTAGHALSADSATQATNASTAADAGLLNGQDGAYYLNRANHTGTQSPATISPQGTGSNLDADTVDGLHASELLDKVTYDSNGDGVVDYATTATFAVTSDLATTATYAEDADMVDGFHASATPTANMLLALDANAKVPDSALPPSATDNHSLDAADGDPVDALYVDDAGNVGIGTTSPQEKLQINGSVRGNQNGALRISTGNGYIDIGPKSTAAAHFYTNLSKYYFDKDVTVGTGKIGSYTGDLSLMAAGTTQVTVQSSNGNVGIGTTSPSDKLTVAGTVKSTTGGFKFPDGTVQTTAAFGDGHSLDAADGSPADALIVDNDGNVGIGVANPEGSLHVAGMGDGQLTTAIKATIGVSSNDNYGVYSDLSNISAANNTALYGYASGGLVDNLGLTATASGDGADGNTGVSGIASGANTTNMGAYGKATGASSVNYGVYGYASGGTSNYAGYFPTGDVYVGGKLGINTASPAVSLDVNGLIYTKGTIQINDTTMAIVGFRDDDYTFRPHAFWVENTNANGGLISGMSNYIGYGATASQNCLYFIPPSTNNWNDNPFPGILTLKDDGKLGVGTTSPSDELTVAGTVRSTTGGFKFPDGTVQTTAAFGDGHSLDAADGSPVNALIVDNDGKVGIGNASPAGQLDVAGDGSGGVPMAIKASIVNSDPNNNYGVYSDLSDLYVDGPAQGIAVYGTTAGAMDNVGVEGVASSALNDQNLGVRGNATGDLTQNIGVFGDASGSNSDNYGVYGYASGGTTNYAGYFPTGNVYMGGNVGIGVTPADKLDVSGVLRLRNTTAPGSAPSGAGQLYAYGGNLYVNDASHNHTQLSSHMDPRTLDPSAQTSFGDTQVALPWSFHHYNPLVGKEQVVDMAKLVAWVESKMEAELGPQAGKVVFEKDIDALSVDKFYKAQVDDAIAENLAKNPYAEVAIGPDGSIPAKCFTDCEVMKTVEETETYTVKKIDYDTMKVVEVTRQRKVKKQESTGKTTHKLKPGYEFRGGKLLRRRTIDDVDPNALMSQLPPLPDWILDRIPDGRKAAAEWTTSSAKVKQAIADAAKKQAAGKSDTGVAKADPLQQSLPLQSSDASPGSNGPSVVNVVERLPGGGG